MNRRALAADMADNRGWWQRFAVLCAIFAAIVTALIILMAG